MMEMDLNAKICFLLVCLVTYGSSNATAKQNLCPDLSVENGFTYSNPSNEEEIFYSCNTGYKPFTGNWWDSVTCSEGSWSEEPLCIRLRCGIPLKVENALITSKPEEFYVDGSSVTYVCQKSFSMNGESTVSCRNGIWGKTPTCEEITCELNSTTIGVKKIDPADKTIFRAGERVEITCAEKYWINNTKKSIKSFTCQDDGQWDHEPVCMEIRCEVPNDQHVYRPDIYLSGDLKLEENIPYDCISGHDKMAAVATCTRDGWKPNPLCGEIRCDVPRDQHVYRPEDYFTGVMKLATTRVYSCMPGYVQMEAEATCVRDGYTKNAYWKPKPLCTESPSAPALIQPLIKTADDQHQ